MAMWAAPVAASAAFNLQIVGHRSALKRPISARQFSRSCFRQPLFLSPFPRSTRLNFSFEDATTQTHEDEDAHQVISPSSQEGGGQEAEDPKLSQQSLLWRAIKLPIYSVALVPLTVGSAAAFYKTKIFHAGRFGILLGSAVLIIAWLNLSNDAYDAETGVDKGKRESVVNMTGSREAVLVSAYACLALGISGLLWVCWQAQNMQIFALEAAAIACGYIYQCPPFRLSYLGLGEPLCFTAFGPLATTAFYLSQQIGSLPITGTILGAATLVGITTTLILFCSHFHQIEGDRSVGKFSPLVRLGTEKGKKVVKVSVIGLYMLALGMIAMKWLPYHCAVLVLLTVPIGKMIVDYVTEHHENKEKIFLAKSRFVIGGTDGNINDKILLRINIVTLHFESYTSLCHTTRSVEKPGCNMVSRLCCMGSGKDELDLPQIPFELKKERRGSSIRCQKFHVHVLFKPCCFQP
ncbi:hypothetical protein GOP47_0012237 [Adiantum capillus-veneris]|uniref:2-carboxy-1,4-naphthoquinone phytyltransferase, chloroplastic n=1 Tax=Adiantum capillus-veneris TaxID=13818 RepID=A0A9D4ZGP3_ADICA|nr:hypothetical protein GOP47_0012237 [Adiantum capillus-veneris]